MTVLVVQLRVRDFDAWKPVFDEHEAARREHGARRHWVYRTVDEPNEVVVAIEFPSQENGQAFVQDPGLREAMQKAGVVSEPHIHFREQVEAYDY